VDFRFKYRRKKPADHELADEARRERDQLKRMRGLAIGLSIPMTLVGGPVAGWLLGAWMDSLFSTSYWTIVMVVLGTVAGFVAMIEMLIKLGREP
jgi:F0F1-type ATP synthase assembly protein I